MERGHRAADYRDVDRRLGAALRAFRELHRITVETVADAVQKRPGTVSMYERGDRTMSTVTFLAFCDVIGAEPAAVLRLVEAAA